jgi:cell wall-associated NlpC family hydrolase
LALSKKLNFFNHITPTHKVSSLISKYLQKTFFKIIKLENYLIYQKLKLFKKFSKFSKFNNQWIESKYIKPINYKNKNYFKDIKIFKNVKYKWGGKTFDGIDCSALVQISI